MGPHTHQGLSGKGTVSASRNSVLNGHLILPSSRHPLREAHPLSPTSVSASPCHFSLSPSVMGSHHSASRWSSTLLDRPVLQRCLSFSSVLDPRDDLSPSHWKCSFLCNHVFVVCFQIQRPTFPPCAAQQCRPGWRQCPEVVGDVCSSPLTITTSLCSSAGTLTQDSGRSCMLRAGRGHVHAHQATAPAWTRHASPRPCNHPEEAEAQAHGGWRNRELGSEVEQQRCEKCLLHQISRAGRVGPSTLSQAAWL